MKNAKRSNHDIKTEAMKVASVANTKLCFFIVLLTRLCFIHYVSENMMRFSARNFQPIQPQLKRVSSTSKTSLKLLTNKKILCVKMQYYRETRRTWSNLREYLSTKSNNCIITFIFSSASMEACL